MSDTTNDDLLDRARELIDYWTGTLHARTLQRDIDARDLESLQVHVHDAAAEQAIQEDFPLKDFPVFPVLVSGITRNEEVGDVF